MIWTVKFEVPEAVGVPEITPASESEIPAGSVPDCSVQTCESEALGAANCCEYAVPTAPFGRVAVVTLAAVYAVADRTPEISDSIWSIFVPTSLPSDPAPA